MKKALILLSCLLLTGCFGDDKSEKKTQEEPILDYYSIADQKINWGDIFSQKEKEYLIYFYSEYCGHCKSIKEEVLSYYYLCEKAFYFVDIVEQKAVIKSDRDSIIGTKSIKDFYILGTPFLINIKEKMVDSYYAGTEAILNFINME